MHRNIRLHPRFFGANMRKVLLQQLFAAVEGTCSEKWGYVVAVTVIDKVGKGKVEPGTGYVTFNVSFKAIVFKPIRNEVIDAVVTTITPVMKGFFAVAGPLQVFISDKLIPKDMVLDSHSDEPCYVSQTDDTVKIQRDSEVRIRITGIQTSADHGLICVGTIAEDFLGAIN